MMWNIYAEIIMPYDDATVDKYIDYAEARGFSLCHDVKRIDEPDGAIAWMMLSANTGIEVTGNDVEGGEPDEILFEPDDLNEDPHKWADVLNRRGAEVIDAWFGLD